MRDGDEGLTGVEEGKPGANVPGVSTSGAKSKARNATDVPSLADAVVDALNLMDQMQTAGNDPRRMKVNKGTSKKPMKNKKWNGG